MLTTLSIIDFIIEWAGGRGDTTLSVTVSKSNINLVERLKINTPCTQMHDRSLSWLRTGTSIKSDGVKLIAVDN